MTRRRAPSEISIWLSAVSVSVVMGVALGVVAAFVILVIERISL